MKADPTFSLAGTWQFNPTSTPAALVDFYSTIHLGLAKSQGVVLGGWAIPSATLSAPLKTTVAILDQNPDGTLKLNTSQYIGDVSTNGVGSIIVTDFNRDGADDIFIAPYNERPFANVPTIVYLSDGVDRYTKLILPDATEAHSAILTSLNGIPTIVTTGYGNLIDSFFQFNNQMNTFDIKQWENSSIGKLLGSSATLGDFLGNGQTELVVVDTHPLNNWDAYSASQIVLYGLNESSLNLNQTYVLPTPYFTNNPNYPGRDTHQYRVWAEDFNEDGRLDLLVAESTSGDWTTQSLPNSSKIQMLQNQGNFVFKDVTDVLGSAYLATTNNVDYSTQMVDLDGSGIKSYLLGDSPLGPTNTQSNYLLLNDGTGHLYAALHDEFVTWGVNVKSYLVTQGIQYNATLSPKFIAYQLSGGAINYVADVATGDGVTQALVNVPVQYNLATDFTQHITISDRNNSMLMRTWAGNDRFYDTNANSAAAHLDGGLGRDTAVYSGAHSQYQVSGLASAAFEIQLAAANTVLSKVDDTLTNIERLSFTDGTLALDIAPGQNAGEVYRLYQAAFARTPDMPGVKYHLNDMEANGLPLWQIASNFLASPEFATQYGQNPTDTQYINALYHNVLNRTPGQSEVDWYQNQFNTKAMDHQAALIGFSESPENVALVGSAIVNGIWLG
jgi:hypothetical protein